MANLAGCLLIGLIAGLGVKTEILSPGMRLLLATGFCGGFTTMSSFVDKLGQFVQDQEYFYASSYLVATLTGAGLAFVLGFGASARIRTQKILDLSSDLPLVIEIVDEEENISVFQRRLAETFEQAGSGGLVTLENIRVVHYLPEG